MSGTDTKGVGADSQLPCDTLPEVPVSINSTLTPYGSTDAAKSEVNDQPPPFPTNNQNITNAKDAPKMPRFFAPCWAFLQAPTTGLTVMTTTFIVVGEMAGSGVLALPKAMVNAGWIGFVVIVVCCLASGYSGSILGQCWVILKERWPQYSEQVRDPYPAIAERAVGKWMRYVTSVAITFTLYGASVVYLLLAAQNLQSLLKDLINKDISFCYWLIIMAAIITPLMWFGTPKDFWVIAFIAAAATAICCVLAFIQTMLDMKKTTSADLPNPDFKSFFLSFGAILFAFGGASTFPTVQHDMKEPKKFPFAVLYGYIVLMSLYIPIAAAGYVVYGGNVNSNILQNLPKLGLRYTAESFIIVHLVLGIIIIANPVCQEFEERCRVPHRFGPKRILLRTIYMLAVLFMGETIPHFGPLLDFIGGSCVTFLTFFAPPLFYTMLCRQKGDWPERHLPLHQLVLNIEIMCIGLVGGVAATYASINELTAAGTFGPPCYVR